MISPEEFLKKLTKSGLLPKEILEFYWSGIYSVLPSITGRTLDATDRKAQYDLQSNLLQKIRRETLSTRMQTILSNMDKSAAAICQQATLKNTHSHIKFDKLWENRLEHLIKLLKITNLSEKEIQELATKLVAFQKKESGSKILKCVKISTFIAAGFTGAYLLTKLVTKKKD